MPAPANDNIANATVITGLSGTIAGTTVDATVEFSEVGWPANAFAKLSALMAPSNGSTVWYEWICPTLPAPAPGNGYSYDVPPQAEFLFTTDDTTITFPSVVQVFTASGTLSAATVLEVTPILSERVGRNCGAANGAALSFLGVSGTTYYIRIGSRNGTQGIFNLRWRQFDRTTLGSCTKCGPTFLGTQFSQLRLTDVTVAGTANFPGTLPAGVYAIAWCKGVFVYKTAETYWNLSAAGSSPLLTFTWPESSQDISNGTYNSEVEAELASQCETISFFTCGGTASMTFNDSLLLDNINNSPNPIFQLIQVAFVWPTNQIVADLGDSAVVSNTGSSWSIKFAIAYLLPFWPGPLTATLLNTGGVTGSSAPQTISAPGNLTFDFTANPGTTFTTATIQLTSSCLGGIVVANVQFPLYPVITLSLIPPSATVACSPSGTRLTAILSSNVTVLGGNMALLGSSTATLTATSSPQPLVNTDSGCTVLSSVTGTITGNELDALIVHILEASSPTIDTLTVGITWASLTYPNFVVNLNAP